MNAQNLFSGVFERKKLLVSTQENAKLSDRSMIDNFIKMTVNGRFSQKYSLNPANPMPWADLYSFKPSNSLL